MANAKINFRTTFYSNKQMVNQAKAFLKMVDNDKSLTQLMNELLEIYVNQNMKRYPEYVLKEIKNN